jgi:hypothetical protein
LNRQTAKGSRATYAAQRRYNNWANEAAEATGELGTIEGGLGGLAAGEETDEAFLERRRWQRGPTMGRESVMMLVLWEKRRKIRKLTIVVYFSLAKASDRIRSATGTVNEAIRIPIIGNKRRTNATQLEKLQLKPYPLRVVSLGNSKWVS